jgi:cytochrome c oxidase accessory protein FixG
LLGPSFPTRRSSELEHALNVTYRFDRGEPRGALKRNEALREQGQPAGDCIDCGQCVAVCPTGVDIRKGLQIDCIQCGLCIDACDAVMEKIDRPTRLIAYDTDLNVQRRLRGEAPQIKLVRSRTVLYATLMLAIGGVMLFMLATRDMSGISVIHDRNPLFVALKDGGIRNAYTVRLLNKTLEPRRFMLTVEGIDGLELDVVGSSAGDSGWRIIDVGPDRTAEVRVLVTRRGPPLPDDSVPITFVIIDTVHGETARTTDHFRGPHR